jgi:hypothetical protein
MLLDSHIGAVRLLLMRVRGVPRSDRTADVVIARADWSALKESVQQDIWNITSHRGEMPAEMGR